eukprot:TRINITY_DN3093_c0_g1_i1.p1 TRINITY_DN3093_c0_g1~~TRINITY_DN3093_c0_g1_i1.p1  ORF type:complete len:633 (+),score=119.99 TRINITY_DN3093_c0_g1_i1:238-1899(+)
MWFVALHSFGYWAIWVHRGDFWHQIWRMQEQQINNLGGEIETLIGLLMWACAIGPVRRKNYELFVQTHKLAMVFVIFLMIHAGDYYVFLLFPSLLLYAIDWIVRAVQSQHLVHAEGANVHADGTLELLIPVESEFQYKPLDVVFINVPAVSRLQWHPFSVCSSLRDGRRQMSLLVKPTGNWTSCLREHLFDLQGAKASSPDREDGQPLALHVEGPYGQEHDMLAKHGALVLIAGGSGLSPFLSLLRDLLHRCQSGQEERLPTSVTLVWVVKSSSSLAILKSLQAAAICPSYNQRIQLQVQLFVTQETVEGAKDMASVDMGEAGEKGQLLAAMALRWKSSKGAAAQIAAGNPLLQLSIFVFIGGVSIGFMSLFSTYVFNKTAMEMMEMGHMHGAVHITPLWARGGLYFLSAALGIFIGAAIVLLVWYATRKGKQDAGVAAREMGGSAVPSGRALLERANSSGGGVVGQGGVEDGMGFLVSPQVTFGRRPDFAGLFDNIHSSLACTDVGVLVSGPMGMVADVAKECKRRNPVLRGLCPVRSKQPALHFHALSFKL